MSINKLSFLSRLILVLIFVYLFLVSIGLMGAAFNGFGKGFAEGLIRTTSNPFIGLFIGILATSIVQSSSTITSIVVGMVGSGVINVSNAIPIIMGANIGTTITGAIVSLGHFSRREEFKRAIIGGTVGDFFKVMCVCILFPLELTFGLLSKASALMSNIFANVGGIKFTSPIKSATKPVVHLIEDITLRLVTPHNAGYIALLLISIIILFISLYFIVRLMKALVAKRAEIVLSNIIGRHGVLAIFAALIFTAIIQSSSITIALMIPLIAAGVLNVETMLPLIMGANIGTTITAILASFATGNIAAITVAFSHFLFNMIGVCCFYPIKALRNIPIVCANSLGELAFKKRRYAILFILTFFFIVPGLLVLFSRLLK
ncbi:Na/Pi symporter [Candidatus Omnitrophota bacterium]